MVQLKEKPCGCPLMLGELDSLVQEYVKQLRLSGGIVSASILMAAARGIVRHRDQAMLAEYGGPMNITKSWAASLMTRMKMVKRKGTRAA